MSGQFDRIVQPGQTGRIPIKVATGHGTGPLNKTITVVTNIPAPNTNVTIQVKGELWQLIQATPNMASFGSITPSAVVGSSLVRKVTITNNADSPAEITNVASTSPAFKGEVKTLEAGKKYELTVTMQEPLKAGAQSGTITMSTGIRETPTLQVAVNAYVVSEVDVVPNKLMLPAVRTTPLKREIYIRNNAKEPLKITELKATSPQLVLALQETQPGVASRISLDIPAEYKISPNGDAISFKTNNPNFPLFTLPIVDVAMPTAPIAGTPPASPVKPPVTGTPAGTVSPQPTVAKNPASGSGPPGKVAQPAAVPANGKTSGH